LLLTLAKEKSPAIFIVEIPIDFPYFFYLIMNLTSLQILLMLTGESLSPILYTKLKMNLLLVAYSNVACV
jgi:hypothetical protein